MKERQLSQKMGRALTFKRAIDKRSKELIPKRTQKRLRVITLK